MFKRIRQRYNLKNVNSRHGISDISRPLLTVVLALVIIGGFAFHSLSPIYAAGSPQLNCFSSPGSCGYPDPAFHNVGVNDCSALQSFSFSSIPSGTYYSGVGNTLEIVSPNVTISGVDFGNVNIYVSFGADNFTLDNSCMTVNGGAIDGSSAVNIAGSVTGTTIENSTISGTNDSSEALGIIVLNDGTGTVIKNNYMFNAGGGAPGAGGGTATVEDNYELINGDVPGEHYEPIYCSDSTLTINHNTLLNIHNQTAEVFCDTGGGSGGACDNDLTITDNLMAGGGYMMYPCGNASSVGTSITDIENNRFARCLGTPFFDGSGTVCTGLTPETEDGHGYYPNGGYFGIAAYFFTGTGQTWCGNFWDDTGLNVTQDGSPGDACPSNDPGGGGNSGSSSGGGASSGDGTTPKAPDTGFGLAAARPLESFAVSAVAALMLAGLAYRLPFRKKYN